MNANRVNCSLLVLFLSGFIQSPAQQSDADRKFLAEIRTKAESGDPRFQTELGLALNSGNFGLPKDPVEVAKWFRKAAEQNLALAQSH